MKLLTLDSLYDEWQKEREIDHQRVLHSEVKKIKTILRYFCKDLLWNKWGICECFKKIQKQQLWFFYRMLWKNLECNTSWVFKEFVQGSSGQL